MLKKIFIFLFSITITSVIAQTYHIPKVLYLTTGADNGRGTVSDGIVLALQDFHKLGATVRLENREILLQPNQLAKFDILIVPTIKGYHDKPQKFSLTYMSDAELINISQWVKNGGTLVSDVNIGRNNLKGNDRLLTKGELNPNTWQLSACFGVDLQEKNTQDAIVVDTKMHIWKHHILSRKDKKVWQLIPTKTQADISILAAWKIDDNTYPGITSHRFGKGNAILLPSFYILHPITDGGLSTDKQIADFYKLVYETAIGKHAYKVQVSPWKNGHTSVYCQTFDDGGNMEQYQRIFDFVKKNELPTVFFVTPEIDKDIAKELQKQKHISIQGHSYNHPDFRKIDYGQTQSELLMNRQFWNKKFKGFRFPYVSNSFWGLYTLDKLDFIYDTSIAANHIDYIRGSVVPYNIPIFKDDFFTTLNLIEISQIYHSDWYFYQKVLKKKTYTIAEQQKDAKRFQKYLINYFDKVSRPNNGIMVYLGHPMYVGISKTTLQALQDLIDHLNQQNVWIASLNEVADRWNAFQNTRVEISEYNNKLVVNIKAKQKITGFSLFVDKKPKTVKNVKVYKVKAINDKFCIIFDVTNETKIELTF